MQSAIWGRKAGMFVVLGLATGILGHTMAVAIGLAAVFAASPMAFTALKLAGAAYLLYLAWQILRAPVGPEQGQRPEPEAGRAVPPRHHHEPDQSEGAAVLLRLPAQFTSPALGPIGPQTVQLGAVFMLATLLVFGAIAFFSGAFGELLQRSVTARRWLNRIAALVFVGLALRLATASR